MSGVERKTFCLFLLQPDSEVVGCEVLIPREEELKKNPNTEIPSLNPEHSFFFFLMVYRVLFKVTYYSGVGGRMFHGGCIVILCKIQTAVHRFYRVRVHAERHCSETRGFTRTSKGLHGPN